MTLTVPLHLLNRMEPAVIDRLVPGMLRDKVAWYLKALPKSIRRTLVPLPEVVTAFLLGDEHDASLPRESAKPDKTLAAALAEFVSRRTGQPPAPDAWQMLLMNLRVVDDAGLELAMGRDLRQLQAQLSEAAQLTFAAGTPGIERDGITVWDVGDLPEEIAFTRNGARLTGFPALVDEGESVALRLFDSRPAAEIALRAGVRRLLRLQMKEQVRQLERAVANLREMFLLLRGAMSPDDAGADIVGAIIDRAFIGEDPLPRREKEFDALKSRARTRLPAVQAAMLKLVAEIAGEYAEVSKRLAAAGASARLVREQREQIAGLIYQGCFGATPWERLQHLPRYLRAMRVRLAKFADNPERDGRHAPQIERLWKAYVERRGKHRKSGTVDPKLDEFRWLIEELRVSLFAQELKTPLPVSVKRLEKFWQSVAV